jgi:hypothetical protein
MTSGLAIPGLMLLTVAGQSPICTAFPILPVDNTGHLCCDQYKQSMTKKQREFFQNICFPVNFFVPYFNYRARFFPLIEEPHR